MKMSFAGSSLVCSFFHRARASATSGRSCSVACTLFFERDVLAREEAPHRPVADAHPTFPELIPQFLQRQIGLRLDAIQQPSSLLHQPRAVVTAHRLSRDATVSRERRTQLMTVLIPTANAPAA